MPKRSNRTLPLVPLNLELEKVVRANRREKRAKASGATSSEPQVVVESDQSSSSETSGETIPLESPRTNSPTSPPLRQFEMAAPNKTLREFGVPPPYQEASGMRQTKPLRDSLACCFCSI